MQTKKQAGFTLIELMIVVAIVGILAAVAIPAYQDYIKRSKMSEVMAAAAACKTSVAEYYSSEAALPDTAQAGCSTTQSQYANAITVAAGVITVPINDANIGIGEAGAIVLSPSSASDGTVTAPDPAAGDEIVSWVCSTTLSAANNKYVPASCR